MTLRVSWVSCVTRNQPLQRGGSGFVSSWTGPQRQIGELHKQIRRRGTIDVHIWGSFVLKPQKQVTRCLTNTHTHTHTAKSQQQTHRQREDKRHWRPKSPSPVQTTYVLSWHARSSVSRWMMGSVTTCSSLNTLPLSDSKWLQKQWKWLDFYTEVGYENSYFLKLDHLPSASTTEKQQHVFSHNDWKHINQIIWLQGLDKLTQKHCTKHNYSAENINLVKLFVVLLATNKPDNMWFTKLIVSGLLYYKSSVSLFVYRVTEANKWLQ